ncbi:hypothetical protein CYLTODRAFT_423475 [Cylindrobasidium torrendii FP15055 ss-10]|uniref:Uncharacterized protein n=1 Tax=Cylindrobasidium torrendii FP15055 ss-10 TaxID=1314674 RepID=A0A0D7B886_9AGAR|nr:hypothetical protein CYLTODRAFT_423475 [Cylindrobasidium torrendii FP15055 ss-10]
MTALASSLPLEILQLIFIFAQDRDSTFLEHAQIIENARMAAIVSHVCQHWRAAALGLRDLWSFVSDDRDGLWQEYAKRSDPLPLAFAVADPEPDYPLPDSTERVHNMVLRVIFAEGRLFAVMNSSSFPNLHTLSVFGDYLPIPALRDPDTRTALPYQNRFLALKNLHLEGVESPGIPVFPCLETLSANVIYIPIMTILIPSASTLTHITFGADIGPRPRPSTRIVLPALKTFTLNNTRLVITFWLCTPALEVLRLQGYTERPLQAIETALSAWKQEPLVMLSELILHVDKVCDSFWNIPNMFVAFPNVRRVRLDIPSRETVSYFGCRLNDHVWTELYDIAVRVKGEDANEKLLVAMQRKNARDLVRGTELTVM